MLIVVCDLLSFENINKRLRMKEKNRNQINRERNRLLPRGAGSLLCVFDKWIAGVVWRALSWWLHTWDGIEVENRPLYNRN